MAVEIFELKIAGCWKVVKDERNFQKGATWFRFRKSLI
jgi:hypothetical protein